MFFVCCSSCYFCCSHHLTCLGMLVVSLAPPGVGMCMSIWTRILPHVWFTTRKHTVELPSTSPWASHNNNRMEEAKEKQKEKKQKHTTAGVRWWSPTQLLICRLVACLWGSRRDPEFSTTYGRMCWKMKLVCPMLRPSWSFQFFH